MGSDWALYDGGIGGDTTLDVMIRQGSVRAKFKNAYTLTYGQSTTSLGGFVVESTPLTSGISYPLNKWGGNSQDDEPRLMNPCTINGVKCRIRTQSLSVTPLAPCTDVPGDWIETYGSALTKEVDVNVFYIGRNGGYTSTDQLVAQNKAMADFAGTDKYIVLGFHESYSQIHAARPAVDDTYITKMTSNFGDHFLNLNAEINSRAAELLVLTGVYASVDAFNEDTSSKANNDKTYIAGGKMPKSFFKSDGYHPNTEGTQAFAILIHDKMVKLGYLTDDYILSTGHLL